MKIGVAFSVMGLAFSFAITASRYPKKLISVAPCLYEYYLIRGFIASLLHTFNLPTRTFELVTGEFEFVTHTFRRLIFVEICFCEIYFHGCKFCHVSFVFIFMDSQILITSHGRGFCYCVFRFSVIHVSQLAITCSKLTIETLKQGLKYFQS